MVVDDHESVWVETAMLRNRCFDDQGGLIHGEPEARGESVSLADSANLELGSSGCLGARLPRHWFAAESSAGSMTVVGLWARRGRVTGLPQGELANLWTAGCGSECMREHEDPHALGLDLMKVNTNSLYVRADHHRVDLGSVTIDLCRSDFG
ncbi:hypothetical protein FH972_005289 [Carpinus fangiana]|uniref:Uncharacterized protein n=1 Tax=Carpinus fangiana TaxID=176857 RepID=A0A5N6QPK2_9ROSI|nr:hypothetical protein FH972_005289 [Carpinus fangiana]